MFKYSSHAWKMIVIPALLFNSCGSAKKESAPSDDNPKEEIAFRLKDVNLKTISFYDNTGKTSKALSLSDANFSDEAILLISVDEAHKGQILSKLIKESAPKSNADSIHSVHALKCRSTWYYNNVPITLYCQVYDPHMTDRVLPRFGTKLRFPPLSKKDKSTGIQIPVYQCSVTVYGNVKCENICSCAGCITCFFSSDVVSMIVEQPDRAEDFVEYAPCNSMNNCSGDSTGNPKPPPGGGGGDSLAKKK